MTTKVRKQVYIEPDQEEQLKRLSAELGVAEAEIIREAIDRHLDDVLFRRQSQAAWAAELEFVQRLRQRGPLEGGRTWRREDLYDRPGSR